MPRTTKAKAAKRAPAAKPKAVIERVDQYLDQVPEAARPMFDKLRATIRSAVPADATEVISYRIPAFARDGVLVWYAAFSKHCSLFPTAAVIDDFRNEFKGFAASRGTIQFPLDKPLPVALIRKIVKARVAQKETKRHGRTR